jgi:N-acetylmuramoyl-L-alanine amidase
MKVAICVGHSRRILGRYDGGAVSVGKVSERSFNSELAGRLQDKLKAYGISSNVFDDYVGSGYSSAMDDVARKVKAYGSDLALELHFNSSDSAQSNGYEYLFHHLSDKGRRLATLLLSEHNRKFPAFKARGVIPIDSNGRGFAFLQKTSCPAVICEPFFGSNQKEWDFYSKALDALAEVYADAIYKYFAQ